MPTLNQITDSINKSYVQLPDGSFAEKIVVVNSDGTAVSGGGGGGGLVSTLFDVPTDGSTVTVTLTPPTVQGTIICIDGKLPLGGASPNGNLTIVFPASTGSAGVAVIGTINSEALGTQRFYVTGAGNQTRTFNLASVPAIGFQFTWYTKSFSGLFVDVYSGSAWMYTP